ncbi:hypothetical protein SD71_12495 [Cohnella kolymensis]|uniref:MTTase N-terminal domain-containing protein n=1 Tax=Cohnella kolymensis TaxID=1590652 RepID=A0ABR5A3S3_9BACL|nr:hypothetical protein SD71_12495 [Cohnella kolymensis]
MPEKVSVVTLGCEKNLVDSEIMSGLVHQRGYSLVDKPEDATVDGEVFITRCRSEIGEIRRVRITHAYEYDLSGEGIA